MTQMSARDLFCWSCCLLALTLVVLLSSISQPVFTESYSTFLNTLPLSDTIHRYLLSHYKLGHPFCYAILAAITCLSLGGRYLLAILLVFSLGAMLEIVQIFLPTRSGSWVDLGYDLVGVFAGVASIYGYDSLKSKTVSRRGAEGAGKNS